MASFKEISKATLKGLQFNVLRSHDILNLSVIEGNSPQGIIQKPKDLYDARLGIPNEKKVCGTCKGSQRGLCDATHACDGHFGHIELPSAIYHPYHVRRVVKLLSKICLGCGKALRKKARVNPLLDDESFLKQSGARKPAVRKRKNGDVNSDKRLPNSRKRKRVDVSKWLDGLNCDEGVPVKEEECDQLYSGRNGWQTFVAKSPAPAPCPEVKEETVDFGFDPAYPEPNGEVERNGADNSKIENNTKRPGGSCGLDESGYEGVHEEARPDANEEPGCPNRAQPAEEGSSENFCKYCGTCLQEGSKVMGPKSTYPKITVKCTSKVAKRGRIETIKLIVEEKARVSQLPSGFWDFVNGHPGAETEKSRQLLPFEALEILKKVPVEDHAMLCMDKVVTHPEAFIFYAIPVTPNCNRLIMDDWNSTLMPRVILGRGGPNSKLEAIVSKVRQITSSTLGSRTFDSELMDTEELQLLVARHMRACKVPEFASFGNQKSTKDKQEPGGSLELKWLKTHLLSKRSNYSARTVVNGDPNLSIGEIGIPYELARKLTLQERVNNVNLGKWQKIISEIKRGRMLVSGPLLLQTQDKLLDLREKSWALRNYRVKVGDILTRCVKNGDYVFANRPPSLHKHSLIALRVKLHRELTFAINPLICTPFDGDFDGDAFHIFVPQSVESMAELRELMSVSGQMVCPQGGQALISLTQDTLLAGHLLTSSHHFFNRAEMEQLSMFCSVRIPPPTIIKTPTVSGPLWTGRQVFSLSLPGKLQYGTPDGDVLVKDGELLINRGGAGWLHSSTNGIVRGICDSTGSEAAYEYLNCIQGLLHQWIMNRGFSVGLNDYYVTKDCESRRRMLFGVKRCLQKSEEASLSEVLRSDKSVQARFLTPRPDHSQKLTDVQHHGCFGLLLGDNRRSPKIKNLQRVAVEKFQTLISIVDNLVCGYMDPENSLLAMLRSGSKGSMSKLIQQTGCLGLQLYKGERLLCLEQPINKLIYLNQSLKCRKEDVFDKKEEMIRQPGYWEAKGIVASSFFEGLNPAEFFLHALSSRGSILREGIEEPNKIMRNLLLFLRDVSVRYDGTVRTRIGDHVIQFQYGGLNEAIPDIGWKNMNMAGEPVGALAATAIAEPSYTVKLESYHQSQLLRAGPIQLLQDTLFPRIKSTLKTRDRSVLLRFLPGFGVSRRALRLKRELEKLSLEKFVSSVELEYVNDGGVYEKVNYGKHMKASREKVKRSCPWQCRVLLRKKTLREYDLDVSIVKDRLNKRFNGTNPEEGISGIVFCDRIFSIAELEVLVFFPYVRAEYLSSNASVDEPIQIRKGTLGRSSSMKPGKPAELRISSEIMISKIIPDVLNTTVKGHEDIEVVKILWEDGSCATRVPKKAFYRPIMNVKRFEAGEVVLEVRVKKPRGSGKRGSAFAIVKEACIMMMDEIDWTRSTPYSIQEIGHAFGLEAGYSSMKKRLGLATKSMGKPVREEHLTLVADTMTHSGEIVGLSLAGYRDFCNHLSISTPFTVASFQEPKKNFFEMAANGVHDSIEGALASTVWGRRIPLGTGSDFTTLTKVTSTSKTTPMERHENVESINRKTDEKINMHRSKTSKVLAGLSLANKHFERNGVVERVPEKNLKNRFLADGDLHNNNEILIKQVEMDQLAAINEQFKKIKDLLHVRYQVGERIDPDAEKWILQEILRHHPNREEKVGCGISFVKVDYHPTYQTSRCFHIVRKDGSSCDFSYQKCFLNRVQGKIQPEQVA